MIVIVAILTTVSVPAYTNYIAKEKLRTAQVDLEILASKFENRYQRVLSYPSSQLDSTLDVKDAVSSNWIPASDAEDFTFSTSDASTSAYTLKATGVSKDIKDCVVFLKSDGAKKIINCDSFTENESWL